MVHVLGVLLAGVMLALGWLLWRGVQALRRLLPGGPRPLRAAPLRLARHRLAHADARAAALTAEVARLRLALRQVRQPVAAPRDRFALAKRAFALRFHPDRVVARGLERAVRVAMFKEHWAELRRIERE